MSSGNYKKKYWLKKVIHYILRLINTYVCLVFFFFGCIHLHGKSFISCFRDLSIQLCSQTVSPSTSILAPAPSPVYVSLIYWKVILFILNSFMQTNSTEKNSLEIWHCWFLAKRYISLVLFFFCCSLYMYVCAHAV